MNELLYVINELNSELKKGAINQEFADNYLAEYNELRRRIKLADGKYLVSLYID